MSFEVGTELPEQVFRVARRPGPVRGRHPVTSTPSTGTSRWQGRGRCSPVYRARHVHDGAGGPRRHQLDRRPGSGHRADVRFGRPVVVPDDDGGARG